MVTIIAEDGLITVGGGAAEYMRGLEIDILARTLWGEARGEGSAGMAAVANVIYNRVKIAQAKGTFWWGDCYVQVCQKPYQFSCWNRSDPNYKKLQMIDNSAPEFEQALDIAAQAIDHNLTDATHGATHYHARGITPFWSEGQAPVAEIGNHIFYKLA